MRKRIPNNIQSLRRGLRLTLEQLAEAVGTNASMIQKLENNGERALTHEWMIRLSKPLKCSPRELIPEDSITVTLERGECGLTIDIPKEWAGKRIHIKNPGNK